eukprot:TRINITY_DN5626_c0_g1_i1.p2 TRINITY_DN5626_c0_g1~~TRINITY_DN5626_c0_g1_i1.p2  ORF type:complete len:54 (+),score=2.24 TRINITY_DN5626_c0_g1_i1:246-407(+)
MEVNTLWTQTKLPISSTTTTTPKTYRITRVSYNICRMFLALLLYHIYSTMDTI